jgi:ABC-type nitrate/sulfonate/bicarbonate transport system permease component
MATATAPPVANPIQPIKRSRINPNQVGRWILSILLFFTGWEILGSSGVLFFIKPPSDVLPTLWEEIQSGEILTATWGTLQVAFSGFAVGVILGVAIGTLTGVSDKWAWVIDPLVSGGWAVPIVMFIPVISIYAGLEFKGKILLVVLMNIFVIIVNTATGVREVPSEVKEMARAFGVSKRDMYRKIVFPWAAPYILTGLRLGLGRSVQGAILADLFLRAENLGLYITYAASSFKIETLLAAVLFITVLAAGLMLVARAVEWWLLRWKAL